MPTTLELFSMHDRVVAVTGAGSGLGRALCEAVADAAASVVCADLDINAARATADALAPAGAHHAVEVDVTDETSVEAMCAEIHRRHGRLDVIFCNAGISDFYKRVDETPLTEWQRVLDVDLTGVFLCAKHAVRLMLPRGTGKIVTTASIWGMVGSDTIPVPAYAAAKGGVISLTRELAMELAPLGITANAIAPGFFNTKIGHDKVPPSPDTVPRLIEAAVRLSPVHRIAEPDEIKGAALFLASSASDLVNGHVLTVDAGATAS